MIDSPAEVGGGATADVESEPGPRWWANPRVAIGAAGVTGLLTLGICTYQLSRPGALYGIDEYDDGFYLGTVMRFVNGTLPYKNFVYPQPPGLPILLAPLGLFGKIVGTRALMADVRILTAMVAAANAVLAALLFRRRGAVPALVAGTALALFPMAVAANKTLMLEPYLVFFCLLGAHVVFHGEELASRKRLLIGGLIFGFACTLKLWAIMPVVVVLACCLPAWQRRVRPVLAGVIAGFAIPSLPFVLLAPSNFFRDLIGIQFLREQSPETTSALDRLAFVTGLRGMPDAPQANGYAVAIAAVVVVIVALAYMAPVRRTRLDWFVLGAATLAVAAMFVSPDFHPHYTYWPAVFVALLLGVCCDRVVRFFGAIGSRIGHPAVLSILPIVVVVLVVAGSVWGITQERELLRVNPTLLTIGEPRHSISAIIPAGACTVTDEPALTLLANRFVPDRSTCPDVVDTFSTWIAYDPHTLPPSEGPFDASLVAAWKSWFAAADYAVFSAWPFRVPFSDELVTWFDQNYRLISAQGAGQVYQFVGQRLP